MKSIPSPSLPPCCSGCTTERRQALQQIAAGALLLGSAGLAAANPLEDGPRAGDWLVPVDADDPTPLNASDLRAGAKQLVAWPHDPQSRRNRDGSRLNRILLVRLDPATLDGGTAPRAADGVLAYSAICTHQGCEVSAWRAQEQTLLCFCHFSQFHPANGAKVVAGPAPRPLPWLPLVSEGGRLLLAGGFNEAPGGHKA